MAVAMRVRVIAFAVTLVAIVSLCGCGANSSSPALRPTESVPGVSPAPTGWHKVAVLIPSGSVLLPDGWAVSVNTSQGLQARPSLRSEEGLSVIYMPPLWIFKESNRARPWNSIYPNSHRSAVTTGTLFGVPCRMRSWVFGGLTSTAAWRVDETSAMVRVGRGPDVSDVQTATIILRSLGVTGSIPSPRRKQ